jgi:phosphoadenosine phosphosulfate reductase
MTAHIESALALLREAATLSRPAFSSSFGAEDMVLLDLIRREGLAIDVFTLDTGRLPEETYALMQQVERVYGRCFETFYPDTAAVQALVRERGINGFYASIDNRKACCEVRKVEPLRRALSGRRAWVSGLRAQQAASRASLAARGWDSQFQVEKFNPLHDWTEQQVWQCIRGRDIPYNALHDRHTPSIGCAPCTRAISVGEDLRAGRWWWENAQTRECGLHVQRPAVIPVRAAASSR